MAVDSRSLKRAQEVFRDESPKSFVIDLGDLSREPWTLLPGQGDFLAEMRTRRFDTLTYARSGTEAEDITLFDRKRHHNIAIYASKAKVAQRGPFYNEDDLVDYDVLDYDIDLAATPDRQWIDGRAQIHLKVRSFVLGTLTFRLADSLVVQSIVSYQHGRLFGIRVKNQNTLVVNLPTPLGRDSELNLTITYAGRLEPQTPDREALALLGQARSDDQPLMIAAEPSALYSSRSYWYPQAPVSDYATARLRISVPPAVDCVASGELEPGFPGILAGKDPTQNRKIYQFTAAQPLRYLAFILSRFSRTETSDDRFRGRAVSPASAGKTYRSLNMSVEANPRQVQRGREVAEPCRGHRAVLRVAASATLPIQLHGRHRRERFARRPQPGLFRGAQPAAAVLAPGVAQRSGGVQQLPRFFHRPRARTPVVGTGGRLAQLPRAVAQRRVRAVFRRALRAASEGRRDVRGMLRQLRKWAIDSSDQGPVSLGYRLGHIRGESRMFRALVYNKGAAVLHMLRRLVGDDAFFRGLRRFYRESRFRKVGTEEFRSRWRGRPASRSSASSSSGSTARRSPA